jgi:putative tricarboxylic transport membrane protein
MKKLDQISGGFWLIFSILVAEESTRLGLGIMHSPGPGLMPFYTSLALAFLALVLLSLAILGKGSREVPDETLEKGNWKKPAYALGALLLYAFFLEKLGYLLCTLLLIGFLLKVIERKPWAVTVTTAVLASLGSFIMFQVWLKIQLPAGILPFDY